MKAGWKTVKLGEVCSFERGLTYSKSDEADAPGITVLRANNVDLNSGQLNFEDLRYINSSVAVDERKYLSANSIIVCTASGSRDHLGKTAHISEPPRMTFGGFMGLLRPHGEIDSRFLFYLTRSDLYRGLISSLSAGTNINNLKGSDLLSWEIPLPPLAEQKRIVALLDEAFAGIDEAKAKAEANLQDAADLFASKLEAVFSPTAKKWSNSTVGKAISSGRGEVKTGPFGTKLSASEYGKDGVPVISVGEIRMGEIILHDRTPRVGLSVTSRMPEYLLEKGDIVFGRKGGVERSAYVTESQAGWFLGSDGIRLRLPSSFNKWFIAYQLMRPAHQNWIKAKATGTTMPSLNQGIIEGIPLLLCDHDQQASVVRELAEFKLQSQPLKEMYVKKIAELKILKSSILLQAFAGKLTA